ncbi:efflux RND transporter periplasmic adaptor subunit [Pontiella sulfatireligans]|uniref:Membrane fusion protein biotin-lipoyl like domain-containing protein n=1 Tax=Pontiella sulfatireligans TaxID=2750658 RepID=A0A6C2URM0_9BACT|nr:hypothetical protein [Pontiella sulfatireligans]VGO22972.1 hypothetical protein SCARR_05071 [Pontiella sulfatireligans]
MPAERKYNIKGTNDFIVLAAIFFFLCLWAVKDAWFPSPNVMEKHPREVVAAFEISGAIGQMHVQEGDAIGEKQLLAVLRRVTMQKKFDMAKKGYTEAKDHHAMLEAAVRNAEKNGASDGGIADLKKNLSSTETAMNAALAEVTEQREMLDSTELKSPSKGVVKELKAFTHSQVDAGETVVVINPKDHFYLFNKSLAIFSFFAFWIFLGIHVLAR